MIVGITGASGTVYGVTALKALRAAGIETHLVISKSGQITAAHELEMSISEVMAFADVVYKAGDVAAAISSGSFRTMGMLVAPCSIRTLSEIATGVTSSLLTRAADVVLKERRKLVLMVRETPLHLGHLRSMTQVTEMGAIVMPPVPAFYTRPMTVDEIVRHSVGRALDLLGVENDMVGRWGEEISTRAS
jgi:4-hydroxy-3-polyprenylbenzoate decarboxylase